MCRCVCVGVCEREICSERDRENIQYVIYLQEEGEEEETMVLEGDGGQGEDHSGREERLYDPEEEEEEEGEEEGEEEEEEEELDLEYDYDEDEDDGTDYLHVDMPWGWRKLGSVSQSSVT